MSHGRAHWVFLALVVAVAAISSAIFLFVKSDAEAVKQAQDTRWVKSWAAYTGVKAMVEKLKEQNRLADALRAYRKFPREFLDTEPGTRVEDEQRELVKKINDLFTEDDKKLRRLIENGDYDGALELIEKMEPYCHDRLLRYILDERRRILSHFELQIRDLYLRVQAEFRSRMEKREFADALRWMHEFVDRAPLPQGFHRKWIQHRPLDYAELKKAVEADEFSKVASLLEPHIAMLAKKEDMDTPREILFDLLCATYGAQALRDADAGVRLFAEQATPYRRSNSTGRITLGNDKFYFVAPQANPVELPPASKMELDDLSRFMARSLHKEYDKAVAAQKNDPGLNIRLGVLFMFSTAKREFLRAGMCFRTAQNLGSPLAHLFRDVLDQTPK